MNLDFTLNKYTQLCESISNSSYAPMTVESYIKQNGKKNKVIILRHDVDSRPANALRIAEIEKEFKLKSTYYFRVIDEVFQKDLIEKIQALGHEIGYHYEVLDKSKGNFENAIKLFETELQAFRKISDIKTICMHGNSRTPWNSRDIWKRYDFTEFDILGEAYLSIDFSRMAYISDSARTWDHKYKVKDIVEGSKGSLLPQIASTDEIIDLIRKDEFNQLYILTHPDEWTDNLVTWSWDYLRQTFRNRAKLIVKWWFDQNKTGNKNMEFGN